MRKTEWAGTKETTRMSYFTYGVLQRFTVLLKLEILIIASFTERKFKKGAGILT